MRWQRIIPIFVIVALVAWLSYGLTRNPNILSSALINKPVPKFSLPSLNGNKTYTQQDIKGQPAIINFWASWCIPCREEHEYISKLAMQYGVPVIGINYKDDPANAKRWLSRLGNPYAAVIVDKSGDLAFDFGVSAVPETFIVDAKGVIQLKETGPMNQKVIDSEVMPLIRKLRRES